LKYRTSQYKWI